MAKTRKIVTAILGSFIEWYDIALVGALAKYINNNFFDESEPLTRLVNIFLIFAVGYLARPITRRGSVHWDRTLQKFFYREQKADFDCFRSMIASGVYIHSVAIFYANYFFYPGYMEARGLIMPATINEVRIIMALCFLILFFLFGKYLNRERDYFWMKISSISTVFLIFPLHYAMTNYGVSGYCISMAILTVLNVIYLLPIAGLLSGLFVKKYRYTGVSLSVNMVSSFFGGTAPLILTILVGYFNSFFAGGMYLFMTAIIGYLTIKLSKESKKGLVYG